MLCVCALEPEHLPAAARLVSRRYQRLREQVPLLPARYEDLNVLLAHLQEILSASGAGVAAFRGERLVGFLTAWQIPAFRGLRSTYSPEWANAADLGESRRIYEALYGQMAAAWLAGRYVAHYISLFPNDIDALKAWHWLGFGMISVDALRSLDPIPDHDPSVQVRRAGPADLEPVMELHEALWQYMKGAPIFLLAERRDHDYYRAWLDDPDRVVWLALRDGEPVALMRLGPADDDVCTIIRDPGTTSIYAAYAREEVRGGGISTALLHHALVWARGRGYERCAVSFEPMNPLATRFWLKRFEPVCCSVFRHLDERLMPSQGPGERRVSPEQS